MTIRSKIAAGSVALSAFLAPSIAFADNYHLCEVNEVMEQQGFIRVRCDNTWDSNGEASGGQTQVAYFALAKSEWDADEESRFTSTANAALLSGRVVRILVEDDATLSPSGCVATNCRRVNEFGMR